MEYKEMTVSLNEPNNILIKAESMQEVVNIAEEMLRQLSIQFAEDCLDDKTCPALHIGSHSIMITESHGVYNGCLVFNVVVGEDGYDYSMVIPSSSTRLN